MGLGWKFCKGSEVVFLKGVWGGSFERGWGLMVLVLRGVGFGSFERGLGW